MFIDRGDSGDSGQPPVNSSAQSSSKDEPVKMALTGSRRAVERMIHLLHRQNIIAGSEWSRPAEIKNTGEVVSVACRRIVTE